MVWIQVDAEYGKRAQEVISRMKASVSRKTGAVSEMRKHDATSRRVSRKFH